MVKETRQDVRVTLMDFGLVKSMESSESFTSAGTILGSPEYMAPEQATPVGQYSPAGDSPYGVVDMAGVEVVFRSVCPKASWTDQHYNGSFYIDDVTIYKETAVENWVVK